MSYENVLKTRAENLIVEALENGFTGSYSDLHYQVFESPMSNNIKTTSEAEKVMEGCGVYRALGRIQKSEVEQFGKVTSDFSDVVELANTLLSIFGSEVLLTMEVLSPTFEEACNQRRKANPATNRKILAELEGF